MRNFILTILMLTAGTSVLQAQIPVWTLDLRKAAPAVPRNLTEKPEKGIDGNTFEVNNLYFKHNDRPWFPLMGEFHYIRYPEEYWEEEIVKMKSAGITIIATYVFWNSHETAPGRWNWEGNRDLRRLISLCGKHHLYVWLRIGPWSHGEQLNGGFPNWIQAMPRKRTNDPAYLEEVGKLFAAIGKQTDCQYFGTGGPVIGVQLENEYASGDPDHIKRLRQMALDAGIVPAYFTVTANTVFHEKEKGVIPLQGAYPYRGWEAGGGAATRDFLYAEDQWIMTTDLGRVYYRVDDFPRGLCEQGCGSQMTVRNRFVVDPSVVEAHLNNQLGRGMNLVGYYMFHGGTQIQGLEEPGLPVSYDFQAPISEFGLLRPSGKYLKTLHNLIRDFGSDLAEMQVVRPERPVMNPLETDTLRYIGRFNGDSGFIFLCNTQVRVLMPDKTFRIKLLTGSDTLLIPSGRSNLNGQSSAILPVNLRVGEVTVRYAMAQPLCRFPYRNVPYLFLYRVAGMNPEIALESKGIAGVEAEGWNMTSRNGLVCLEPAGAGPGPVFITSHSGQKSAIILLTREQAENAWRTTVDGQETLLISSSDLLFYPDYMEFRQLDSARFRFDLFPTPAEPFTINGQRLTPASQGIFSRYSWALSASTWSPVLASGTGEVTLTGLPSELPEGLSDLFISVAYRGGKAILAREGAILTDNLYNGTPWMIGLKRFLPLAGAKGLTIQAQPFTTDITGIEKSLVGPMVTNKPVIDEVAAHPQYFCRIKGLSKDRMD